MDSELVWNYKENVNLRESFNQLAIDTFGIDFRGWYNRGYWDDKYIPYSFIKNGKVISNVSVNKMDIIIEGKNYKAIQIGTVMTEEQYENLGLARKLMEYVMDEYKDSVDFIYLFANDTVLNFYPKFEFKRLDESEFVMEVDHSIDVKQKHNLTKLDLTNLDILEKFAKGRKPISKILGVEDNNLMMFYFTIVFNDNIYYIDDLDTIIVMQIEEDELHLYDILILEDNNVDMEEVLSYLVGKDIDRVVFHFIPDDSLEKISANIVSNDDDALFIYGNDNLLNKNFVFPITSHC